MPEELQEAPVALALHRALSMRNRDALMREILIELRRVHLELRRAAHHRHEERSRCGQGVIEQRLRAIVGGCEQIPDVVGEPQLEALGVLALVCLFFLRLELLTHVEVHDEVRASRHMVVLRLQPVVVSARERRSHEQKERVQDS